MFVQNPLQRYIAKQLAGRKPDWQKVLTGIAKTHFYDNRKISPAELVEFHITQSLEDICSDLDGRVVLSPIQHGTATENYQFNNSYGILSVLSRRSGQTITEYDSLVLTDELPVIIEVTLHEELKLEKVARKILPIEEYFGTQSGCLYILTPDNINTRLSSQKFFVEHGGIIIPLYADRNILAREARETIKTI